MASRFQTVTVIFDARDMYRVRMRPPGRHAHWAAKFRVKVRVRVSVRFGSRSFDCRPFGMSPR